MALPKKKRARRDEVDLKQPDEFISFSTKAFGFVGANRKPFIIGCFAFAVAVAAAWGVREWSASKAAARGEAFARAVDALRTPIRAPAGGDDAEAAEAGDKQDDPAQATFAGTVERAQAAASELAAIGGDSGVGALARLGTATARLDMGETDTAIAGYREFLAGSPDPSLRFFGLEGLVTALVDKGELEAALEAAEEIEALDEGAFSDEGAWLTGRILERKGDADGARAAYRGFLEKHADSLLKPSVEKRLALLGG